MEGFPAGPAFAKILQILSECAKEIPLFMQRVLDDILTNYKDIKDGVVTPH